MADSRNEENPVFFYRLSAIGHLLWSDAIHYQLYAIGSSVLGRGGRG